MLLKEIVFFVLPILLAGIVHHFLIIRYNFVSFLAKPVDFNFNLRGKRLLGKAKTWRGIIIVFLLTGFFIFLIKPLFPDVIIKYNIFIAGIILGLGYSLGELPNSFVKRRLDISESTQGYGIIRKVFAFIDHIDSVIGSIFALFIIYHPSFQLVIFVFIIGSLLHLVIDRLLYQIGYKKLKKKPVKN